MSSHKFSTIEKWWDSFNYLIIHNRHRSYRKERRSIHLCHVHVWEQCTRPRCIFLVLDLDFFVAGRTNVNSRRLIYIKNYNVRRFAITSEPQILIWHLVSSSTSVLVCIEIVIAVLSCPYFYHFFLVGGERMIFSWSYRNLTLTLTKMFSVVPL